MRPRLGPLLAALLLIAGVAGAAVGLLRLADRRATDRAGGPPEDEGPPVVLEGDGIGAFRFGAPPDEVIAGLTLRWGPPDGDTGWLAAATSPYGVCPGSVVRGVEWRGFSVLFSDGATPFSGGARHFFTWHYEVADPARPAADPGGNRPPLQTGDGVSVGMTVQALQRAYGDALELSDEPPRGPRFGVRTPDGGLFGSVTALHPAGVVRSIGSGGGCRE